MAAFWLLCFPLRALRADQSPARTCEGPAETKFRKGAAGFSRALCATPPDRARSCAGGKRARTVRVKKCRAEALFLVMCVCGLHTHKAFEAPTNSLKSFLYICSTKIFDFFMLVNAPNLGSLIKYGQAGFSA